MNTVSIVGVGLIGGSFALALRRAGFTGKIIGVSSPRTVEEALRLGVIGEARPLEEAAAASDLIYLAQPIFGIIDTIARLDSCVRPGALVTDAGSTKVKIVNAAKQHLKRAVFLGGHPMAGKESRGVGAAEAGLFANRTYVLTPEDTAELWEGPGLEFLGWVEKIGARPFALTPEQHDRAVALASHLPQLASTALAASLTERSADEAVESTAGPGLSDMTRLALSPFDIWADILATNTAPIEEGLSRYIEKLEEFRRKLTDPDLARSFEAASEFARRVR